MNAILENIIHTGVVRSHLDRPLEVHSGIQVEEGQLLQEIISDIKPKVSLEVGLAYGISSLFICEALDKTARHILIDPDQFGDTWQGIGLLNLEKAGYKEQIEFYAEPSHVVLPRLRARGLEIDFAFID